MVARNRVVWTTGFVGVGATLMVAGGRLVGEAHPFTGVLGGPPISLAHHADRRYIE